jgi:hypothetical protein
LPWQPEFLREFNTLNNFGRASCKGQPCKVSTNLAEWFRRRSCLKIFLMHGQTNDGQWAITKAHLEDIVLRSAKNVKKQTIKFWELQQRIYRQFTPQTLHPSFDERPSLVSDMATCFCEFL